MSIRLETAKKSESDAKLVMEWRNDPETLRMSYHSTPKKWDSFYQEYCEEYFRDTELFPVFALLEDERISFLKFNKYGDHDFKGNTAEIGINLCPQKRGMHLGTAIIKAGAQYLFNKGYATIVAEIKQINIASIRTFEKAGFVHLDSMQKKVVDSGEVFPIHRYILHHTQGQR